MFDFLSQTAGFEIGETGWILYDASQPLWRALLVGLSNTLRVCLPALLLATLIGLTVALARRSSAAIWRHMAKSFVDVVRNVPLLLQLLVWYFLLVAWLPDSTEALHLGPGLWLSKGGLAFPWLIQNEQGLWQWDWPLQEAFNVSGGAAVTPEYLALALALSTYTGAFLSEVIRSGLESVPASLMEAAETLGATRAQQITRVLIPQALRTVIPGATNQFLNLIKNSSLAVAIGYPDLVSVGNTTMNQTGKAFECLAVMMSVYLLLSLIISAAMNHFNRHQALKGGS